MYRIRPKPKFLKRVSEFPQKNQAFILLPVRFYPAHPAYPCEYRFWLYRLSLILIATKRSLVFLWGEKCQIKYLTKLSIERIIQVNHSLAPASKHTKNE